MDEVKDPRKAATLRDAARNPDGTYDGLAALSWLSAAASGGHGLSVDEVRKIADEVKARKQHTVWGNRHDHERTGCS